MEPVMFLRALQASLARRLRQFNFSARNVEVRSQIAAYGSQRMCQSCGMITARSKPFCLECGELLPAV